MRAIGIVGSRHWHDFDAFRAMLPDLSAYDVIVSGCAKGEEHKGVDTMAWMLAAALDKAYFGFPPRQGLDETFTQAAHARNQEIVDALVGPTIGGDDSALLAFPGPQSRGTWDTIRRAIKAGLTEDNGRLIIRVALE